MGEVATILNCGIGKNCLLALLRKKEVLQDGNIAFQKYIENGYFTIRYKKVPTRFRSSHTYPVTLITEKGLSFIQELFAKGINEKAEVKPKTMKRELDPDEMWVTEMTEINNHLYPIDKIIKYDPLKEDQYPKFLFEMPKAK